jgi:hypothetical protein
MEALVRDRFASVRSSAPFAVAALLAWVTVPIATSVDWTGRVVRSGKTFAHAREVRALPRV